jgi:hypothetical protein
MHMNKVVLIKAFDGLQYQSGSRIKLLEVILAANREAGGNKAVANGKTNDSGL